MGHVLHDAVHRPAKELLVLVVHRHDDEQLRATRRVVEDLAKREPVGFEIVGVTGGCGITHVCVLAVGTEGAQVEKLGWDGDVVDEMAVEESTLRVLILAENER